MKRIQKWSPVCLPIVLIVGVVVGWLVAQQASVTPSEAQAGGPQAKLPAKLRASSTPPPETQELEKAGAPPTPEKKGPNTRESVLEKLRSFRSGNARPASAAPPPEVQELEKAGAPPDQTQRQKPTKQGLLEKIRNMPGGPEMIEEAKRRGARIGMRSDEPGTSLSYLNPFKVKEAEAQSTFSLTLTPASLASSSPFGYATFHGVLFGAYYPVTTRVRLTVCNYSSTIGTQISQPFLGFAFDAPADGWYIVNFEATGANASTKHYASGTYSTLQTWSYSGTSGTLSYPVLVELAAGRHYFYWVSSTSAYVYEANAYSL